jgi:hypothetical protein
MTLCHTLSHPSARGNLGVSHVRDKSMPSLFLEPLQRNAYRDRVPCANWYLNCNVRTVGSQKCKNVNMFTHSDHGQGRQDPLHSHAE